MPQSTRKSARATASSGGDLFPDDPTLVTAWRTEATQRQREANTPVLLDLPSGKRVQVLRLSLRMLLNKGFVPDALTSQVSETIAILESGDPDAGRETVLDEFKDDPVQSYLKWLNLLNFVWLNCVVFPRFAKEGDDDPDKDIFSIDLVEYNDKLYVYQWTQGVDQAVQDFLDEQARALGIVGDGNEILDAAQQLLRVERVGGRLVDVHDRPGGVPVGDLDRGADGGDEEGAAIEDAGRPDRGPEVHPGADQAPDLGTAAVLKPSRQRARPDPSGRAATDEPSRYRPQRHRSQSVPAAGGGRLRADPIPGRDDAEPSPTDGAVTAG